MTPVTALAGQTLAVFGLGNSGLLSCRALVAGGAKVIAFDDDPKRVAETAAAGIATADLRAIDWADLAALVLAPGVPLTHPKPHWTVELARHHGKPIIGDIELFCRERAKSAPDAPLIAITGTNGKSTTTALIAHILKTAGRDVQMGGNIGTPILALEPPSADRVHVIECSSFQIDLAPSLNPTVGILTNLSEDHLDRHGTMENYAAIKERLVANSEVALVSVDDTYSDAIGKRLSEREATDVWPVSVNRALDWGIFVDDGRIIWRPYDRSIRDDLLGNLSGISTLRGRHNAQNAAFAAAACWFCHLKPSEIAAALKTFPGLAHRMEEVGYKGRVLFVNDSKATNADSAACALACFDDVFWILGGKSKTGGITSLTGFFPRIRKAYLIGEASEEFAATLQGEVTFERCGTLARAVEAATADAERSGLAAPVVLLSPACASFDQYRNFDVRGDAFRELVLKLPAVVPIAAKV